MRQAAKRVQDLGSPSLSTTARPCEMFSPLLDIELFALRPKALGAGAVPRILVLRAAIEKKKNK
jgi:hypothetical protein